MTPQDVLTFWFVETSEEQWFTKDDAFDETLRRRFLAVYEEALEGRTASWRSTPEGRLAEILVLDQFTRNMFRGSPRAFAADEVALSLAHEAVANGDDLKLEPKRRRFVYMPYMHSESIEAHDEATKLFENLGDESTIRYERLHREIIERFGRYPHRNKALGRTSTPEELEFLKTNPGF
jgi:uncharacterized protein (DUF924 family)